MFNIAHAQTAAQQPSMLASFVPLILIFLIFYFLLIRPQQKRQKEHKILLESIKRNDEILTSEVYWEKYLRLIMTNLALRSLKV